MSLGPAARKLALTAHVTASVGWLGALTAFAGLAAVVLTEPDEPLLRAAYLAAEPLTRYVLVPFSVASLATGLVSALGTPWGLVRHYWVLCKLLINVVATAVLLLYTRTVGHFAAVAADPTADPEPLRSPSFALHTGLALTALVVATVLAVYKPRGRTGLGRRAAAGRRYAGVGEAAAASQPTRS